MITLSIIIPTRNRADVFFNTLKSIENQTLDQSLFEVIVCDNNSTDNTAGVASSFASKFQHFKYIKTLDPGLHVGRNRGFQEAKGEILVYVDDDIEALPEWLYSINTAFEDPAVMLAAGKNLPKWEEVPPDWALKMWEPNQNGDRVLGYFSILDLGEQIKEINPYYVFGCNFSVRKSVIVETNGFHPDGFPQEIIEYRGDGESAVSAYIIKKKYKTIYHPKASVYHLVPKSRLSIDYLKKRGFNQGVSDSYTSVRNATSQASWKFFNTKSVLKRVLRHILRTFRKKVTKPVSEVNIYHNAMAEGRTEGYSFHQKKVKDNPELKAWVLKDNYL